MDPLTAGLVIAAIVAGIGIKRAAAPSRPSDQANAPEAPSSPGVPLPTFGGGLRPAVTQHGAADRGGAIEGAGTEGDEGGAGGDEGESDHGRGGGGGRAPGLDRAILAVESGSAADVAGAAIEASHSGGVRVSPSVPTPGTVKVAEPGGGALPGLTSGPHRRILRGGIRGIR